MTPKRCIITGGTGAVGPAVAQAFQEAGYAVTVASRSATSSSVGRPGVSSAQLDVTDPRSFGPLFEGADVIIHLASLLHVNNPGESLRADYERVNVEGTRSVVAAAQAGGARRVLFASSISVYGYDRGEMLTESSEPRPDSLYGQTKLEAERVALGFADGTGAKLATVLRLPAVYGAGMKGNYRTLLHALAKGRFVPIGPGKNARTLIHAKDAARALLLTAESPEAAGRIYNVTDGEVHSLHSVLEAMCGALGRSFPSFTLPVALVRAGAVPADILLKIAGSPKRITTLLEKYLEDVRVSGERFSTELGFSPRFDLNSGWKDAVDHLRASGELPPV